MTGYVATATSCGVGACSGNTGLLNCVAGGTVDSCDPLAGATADTTCNGIDENCDGTADDGLCCHGDELRRWRMLGQYGPAELRCRRHG